MNIYLFEKINICGEITNMYTGFKIEKKKILNSRL